MLETISQSPVPLSFSVGEPFALVGTRSAPRFGYSCVLLMLSPVPWRDFTTALIDRLGMVGLAQLDSTPQLDSLRSISSHDDERARGGDDA